MDTLPLELHSQIFELVCLDDGSTGRSLSLVSRYVHNVAEPFAYQSLRVAGLSSITELLNRLKRTTERRRRTRRLFLSDWTRKQAQQEIVPDDDERFDLERDKIIELLDLVAPFLESLAFTASCPYNSAQLLGHLFSLHLPHLRSLVVHGFYPFPHAPHTMPALEYLHLSGNRNPHGLLQTGALSTACPNLVHLRVSGLVAAPSFAEELAEALHPSERPSSLFPSSLPKHVGQISVQAGPAPPASLRGRRQTSAQLQHTKMQERLRSLRAQSEAKGEGDVEVVLLEAKEGDADTFETMFREWADDVPSSTVSCPSS